MITHRSAARVPSPPQVTLTPTPTPIPTLTPTPTLTLTLTPTLTLTLTPTLTPTPTLTLTVIDEQGRERADWLRNWILSETRAHRNKLASGVENAHSADGATNIARLGKGSLGGKGRGFRFLHSVLDATLTLTLTHPSP